MTNTSPAKKLEGMKLDGGWEVLKMIERSKNATGGRLSVSYLIKNDDGTQAFLKAMDYHEAFKHDDPARHIKPLVDIYNFERDILELCNVNKLSKVVNLLGHGSIRTDEDDPFTVVQYIIFELADGDIRKHIEDWADIDLVWTLRMLHNVAIGMKQLHSRKIAHQDLKPSNVIHFEDGKSKVTDLGRASCKDMASPADNLDVAGDKYYAAPEHLYKHIDPAWENRRFGGDLYHFGSLIVFMFTGANMSSLMFSKLDDIYHWLEWGGEYNEVLPYLQDAFSNSLTEIEEVLDDEAKGIKNEIITIISQLCNPDPIERGHPKDKLSQGCQYSLERFSNILDRLAKEAEIISRKAS